MRPINVSLSANTWELAKRKKNFSQWIRLQLHAEKRVARELAALQADLEVKTNALSVHIKVLAERNTEIEELKQK
jgi:hypothetical protein